MKALQWNEAHVASYEPQFFIFVGKRDMKERDEYLMRRKTYGEETALIWILEIQIFIAFLLLNATTNGPRKNRWRKRKPFHPFACYVSAP